MVPGVATADHDPPGDGISTPAGEPVPNQGGEGAKWELIETLVTGNPHTDLDFFEQDGITYVSVGTLAVGGNNAGQTIVKLTNANGNVSRDTIEYIAGHPSATCLTNVSGATGLQHDVEATPKGDQTTNATDAIRRGGDTQLLLDATDQRGRCHDQGVAGISGNPRGGIEIIDVTDVANPKEIGLISHIAEAHTVNVDPRRPHIIYSVSSSAVPVNQNGQRMNEPAQTPNPQTGAMEPNPSRFELDGFEISDISSCMNIDVSGLSAADALTKKRDECRPEVYRFRYPSVKIAQGTISKDAIYGCHELEIYPDDRLTCGAGAAMILFDMSGAFDDNGTPKNYADDTINGDPLPCRVRDSLSDPPVATGAKVTDCVEG